MKKLRWFGFGRKSGTSKREAKSLRRTRRPQIETLENRLVMSAMPIYGPMPPFAVVQSATVYGPLAPIPAPRNAAAEATAADTVTLSTIGGGFPIISQGDGFTDFALTASFSGTVAAGSTYTFEVIGGTWDSGGNEAPDGNLDAELAANAGDIANSVFGTTLTVPATTGTTTVHLLLSANAATAPGSAYTVSYRVRGPIPAGGDASQLPWVTNTISTVQVLPATPTDVTADGSIGKGDNSSASDTINVTVNGVTPGYTVNLYDSDHLNTVIGTAVVPADATSVDITTTGQSALSAGPHYLRAKQTDPVSGLISLWSPIVDSTPDFIVAGTGPTITSTVPHTATVGTQYTYAVVANNPHGGSLTYSLLTKPTNMSIDSTGNITWTPRISDGISQDVIVRVSDSTGAHADQSFTVSIADPTALTQITSEAPATMLAGTTLTYLLTTDASPDDPLTYSFVEDPGTGWEISNRGVVTYQASSDDSGTKTAVVEVTDQYFNPAQQTNFNTAQQTITFTVLTPSTLQFANTGPTSGKVGVPYSYTPTTDAVTGQTLTYSLAAHSSTGMHIDAATGAVTWTPMASEAGQQSFTIHVTDQLGHANDQTTHVTVAATPLHITSHAGTTATTGTQYSYAVTTDSSTGTITYSLTSAPTNMHIDSAGVVTWTPTADQGGAKSFTVHAADQFGNSDDQTNNVTVTVVSLSIESVAPTTATAGTLYSYQVTTQGASGTVAYAFDTSTTHPAGMNIDASTGLVTWTPTVDQIGPQAFAVQATADGITVTQTNSVTVQNGTVTITPLTVTQATVGQAYSYQLTYTPSGDSVTFSAAAPTLTGMTISSSGLITWTPSASQVGTQTFGIQANDTTNGGSYQLQAAITVAATTIQITSTGGTAATVGQAYSYQVQTSATASQTLTYSLTAKPDGMTISSAGNITWTPSSTQTGTQTYTVKATDQFNVSATQTVTVTVAAQTSSANPVVQLPTVSGGGQFYRLWKNGSQLEIDQRAATQGGADVVMFKQALASTQSLAVVFADNENNDLLEIDFSGTNGAFTVPGGVTVRGNTSPGSGNELVVNGASSGNHTFTVTGNTVVADGLTTKFSAVTYLQLQGNGANDTYKLPLSNVNTTVVNASGGFDTLDFSAATAAVNVNLGLSADLNASGATAQNIAAWNNQPLNLWGTYSEIIGSNFADTLTGGIAATTILRAGKGNATLIGGSHNNILVGGGGNVTLRGGAGQNFLIGGSGKASMYGGGTRNTYVCGSTTYDANDQALMTLLSAGDPGASFAWWSYRRALLKGTASQVMLIPGVTVNDSVAADQIYGNGSQSWYMTGKNGTVVKK